MINSFKCSFSEKIDNNNVTVILIHSKNFSENIDFKNKTMIISLDFVYFFILMT